VGLVTAIIVLKGMITGDYENKGEAARQEKKTRDAVLR
jgi:hypothetical protein